MTLFEQFLIKERGAVVIVPAGFLVS